MTTWRENAEAFRELDAGEGWAFARLCACSTGRGGASLADFAAAAGTTPRRVDRYNAAWDAAARDGLCTPRTDLTPDDAHTTPEPSAPWRDYYDSRTGLAASGSSTEGGQRAARIRAQAEADGCGVSKAVDIASNPRALAAAIKADPATAEAAIRALAERPLTEEQWRERNTPRPVPAASPVAVQLAQEATRRIAANFSGLVFSSLVLQIDQWTTSVLGHVAAGRLSPEAAQALGAALGECAATIIQGSGGTSVADAAEQFLAAQGGAE